MDKQEKIRQQCETLGSLMSMDPDRFTAMPEPARLKMIKDMLLEVKERNKPVVTIWVKNDPEAKRRQEKKERLAQQEKEREAHLLAEAEEGDTGGDAAEGGTRGAAGGGTGNYVKEKIPKWFHKIPKAESWEPYDDDISSRIERLWQDESGEGVLLDHPFLL